MRCLVTGGKGFIGSHLVNFLKSKGHWVRNADIKRDSYLETHEDVFHWTDLTLRNNAFQVVKNVDWVFNLSANMGGIGYITKVKADVMRDNVRINTNILEACVNYQVKRVFFSSSACVYPQNLQLNPTVNPLRESDVYPAYPDSAYGWEKLFTELMMEAYKENYGLNIRIARFHNVYGPYGTFSGGREKAPQALCRKVAEAEDGGSIEIWGDGEQTRSFLYVSDALDAIYKLMKSDHTEPLNIGSDVLISIDELANIIIEISGKTLTKTYNLNKPQGVRGRNADLTKITNAIDWKPKVDYKEGLTETYRWIEGQIKK